MIRFDTRDTKPKITALVAVTLIAIAAGVALTFFGGQSSAMAVDILLIVYLAVAFALLVRGLIAQIRYNPYSYNTIYYSGFALFTLVILGLVCYIVYTLVQDGAGLLTSGPAFILVYSSKLYMFVSAPFILAFSLGMCVSNISLIRHEGFRPTNLLGIALSVCLVVGWYILVSAGFFTSGSMEEVLRQDLIVNSLSAVYLYLECMLIGTAFADILTARYQPDRDKDFLIVLGSGLMPDGTPTPLLRGRINRALDFWRRQLEEAGRAPVFVCSGGQGADEAMSEAASMKNYLLSQGVPEDSIVCEDRSANTRENMAFSKEIIDAMNPEGRVAFSTTGYHVFRSGVYACRARLRAQGMGAPTKWYFWPNAAVREFAGLLVEHRGKQALILGATIAIYAILTYVFHL